MTLEELEIVVKADISDATKKLNDLKAQMQSKVQNVAKQVEPAIKNVTSSISSVARGVTSEFDIVNKQIDLQAKKVQKLKKEYIDEMKYAKAYAQAGTKNWVAPDVDTARTKYEQAQLQLDKLTLRSDKMREKMAQAGEETQKATEKVTKSVQKATKHTNKFIESLKRMVKFMIIRKVIHSAIQGFNDLAKYSDTFNKSLSNIQSAFLQTRNSIATAFAPIIQALTPIIVGLANAITQLFTALAQLTTVMFTNNTTFTKAKKVTTDYAQSVGKAKGQLAKFDELNVISDPNGGMPKASEMFEKANIDDKFLTLKDRIKDIFADLKKDINLDEYTNIFQRFWDSISKLGNPLQNWFEGDFSKNLQEKMITIKEIFRGLSEDVRLILDTFFNTFLAPFISTFVQYILPVLTQLSTQIVKTISTLFNTINGLFQKLWKQGIEPIIAFIMRVWDDLWQEIQKAWDKWGSPIFDGIRQAIEGIGEIFNQIWDSFLKPVLDNLMEALDWLWEKHLRPLVARVLDLLGEIGNAVLILWNNILQPILSWVVDILAPILKVVVNTVVNLVASAIGVIADVLSGLLRSLQGVIEFIAGVFTGDWEKAWQGIKDFFGGIWDSIVGIVKGAINMIVDFINGMIESIETALNWIVDKINSIKIVNPIDGEVIWSPNMERFQFGRIPKLANGGVLDRPTTILAGEYAGASTNPEIVAPQQLLLETSTQANIPVMNSIEEMGDRLVSALNNIGVYAEFDYSKLKVGLDNENYRVGGKLYGI